MRTGVVAFLGPPRGPCACPHRWHRRGQRAIWLMPTCPTQEPGPAHDPVFSLAVRVAAAMRVNSILLFGAWRVLPRGGDAMPSPCYDVSAPCHHTRELAEGAEGGERESGSHLAVAAPGCIESGAGGELIRQVGVGGGGQCFRTKGVRRKGKKFYGDDLGLS